MNEKNGQEKVYTPAELDYIDEVVSGTDTKEAFLKFIPVPEGMDDFQFKQYQKEFITRMYGAVGKRRAVLRTEGLLEEIEDTRCTEKQLNFVRNYLMYSGKPKRAFDAYKDAYDTSLSKDSTIYSRSQQLLKEPKIKAAIQKYRDFLEEETGYSLGEYIRELNEVREEARKVGQYSVMHSATIEKGKIFGYNAKKEIGSKENPFNISVNRPIEDIINDFMSDKPSVS